MPPKALSTDLKDLLTAKELLVAKLVSLGHTNASVALYLGIRPGTVKNHLTTIFKILGCGNRVQLAARYLMECGPNA